MTSRQDKGQPLSYEQKLHFVRLIKQNPNILDKSNDHLKLGQKAAAWDSVTKEFNAAFPISQPKSTYQLKRSWEYIRNRVKKAQSNYIRKCHKAGVGGVPPPKPDELTLLAESLMDNDLQPVQERLDTEDTDPGSNPLTSSTDNEDDTSLDERRLLISLFKEKKAVLLNKKTDGRIMALKAKAWEDITRALNSADLGPPRNVKQIKKIWENMKDRAQKVYVEQRMEVIKTGDGDVIPDTLAVTDEVTEKMLAIFSDELLPPEFPLDSDNERNYVHQKFGSLRKLVKPGGSAGDPVSKRDLFDHLTCLVECDQETVSMRSLLPSSESLNEEEVHGTSSLTQPPHSAIQQKHLPHQQEHTEITGPARKRRAPMSESSSCAAIKQPKIVSVYMQRHAEDSPQGGASHNGSGKPAPKSHQLLSNLPTSSAESADEDSTEGGTSHVGCGESVPTSHLLPCNMPTSSAESTAEAFEAQHTTKHFGMILTSLAKDELFMDVTLTAEGQSVKAHKSVLSAVSPYFREVLRSNPCQHPVIIMPYNALIEDLKSIVSFIYTGELTVSADRLKSILRMGEVLEIEGLCSLDSVERDKAADPCSVLPSSQSFHSNTSKMKPKNVHQASRLHDSSSVSNVIGTFIDVENLKESSVPPIRVKQFAFVAGDDATSSLQNSAVQASENEPHKVNRAVVRPVAECTEESTESRGKSDPSYISKTTDVDSFLSGTTTHTNHSPNQILEGSSSSQLSWEASSDAVKYECESPLHLESIDVKIEPGS